MLIRAEEIFVGLLIRSFSTRAFSNNIRSFRMAEKIEKTLWIDTDCGFDDFCAICLLDSFMTPTARLRIGFISTVNGMIDPITGADVLTKMFESTKFVNKPIISCGFDSTCRQKNTIMNAEWGKDYRQSWLQFVQKHIGNTDIYVGSNIIKQTTNSLAKIDDMVQKILVDKTQIQILLCLGPLTNIAYIIRNYPTFLQDHVAKLVIMGMYFICILYFNEQLCTFSCLYLQLCICVYMCT
jgi:inosine-uridine nucleoside N-ribohydrolase